jgi:uncharacterized membrane protein
MSDPSAPTHERQEASAAALVKQLSEQTSRLVRQEVELAKVELTEKGKRAGVGAGMFGAAGLFGLYALGALTTGMATWLAALIVAAVWGAIAGVMALTGKKQVKQAVPPVPEDTVESVKEDVQWTKARAQQGRR